MNSQDERLGRPGTRKSNDFFEADSAEGREEVRNELRRILSGPSFQNSKRYAAVLKFIVDQTLHGNGNNLKERTIGIEVFGRAPDYDTGTDHAVRSAVAEVRKRLAKHYELTPTNRVRIEVLPGSYLPQFLYASAPQHAVLHPQGEDRTEESLPPAPAPIVDPTSDRSGATSPRIGRFASYLGLFLSCGALLAWALGIGYSRSNDPIQRFWSPIISSRSPVLLCIGDMQGGRGTSEVQSDLSPSLTLSDYQNSPFETASVYDAMTMAKFAGLLEANGRPFRLKSQSDATFTDLQNGPTILVGLLNNNWTERLVPGLRFTVENSSGKFVIRDRNNTRNRDWSVDYSTPYLDITRDYALVLRMLDPKTEQMVVVAAGITVFGTSAAGDFLTSKSEIKELSSVAPAGWEKKNMEIVLSTDVIRGRTGPAHIAAAQFW